MTGIPDHKAYIVLLDKRKGCFDIALPSDVDGILDVIVKTTGC